MYKVIFGTPEQFVPTKYCENFQYNEEKLEKFDVNNITFKITNRGCQLEMPLEFGEEVFGLGLQLKGFNHKGTKKQLRVNSDPVSNTGDSHAPVPFFVTTNGYGIFVDTARYAEFYCGYSKNKNRQPTPNNSIITSTEDLYVKCGLKETTNMVIDIPIAKGVEIYIFEGNNITEIVSEYNKLSGGGCLPSKKDLGVFYRCYAKFTGDEVIAMSNYFREKEIPCDILGLEPGWQSSSYSCSYVWDQERFPNYDEVICHLRKNNFHISLWEHAFVSAISPLYDKIKNYSGDFEVWKGLIPDFSIKETQEIFANYHKENFVDKGINGFKLDECDNSDFVCDWSFPNCTQFPSGLDGEQYHCLFGTLYMQTILKALGETSTLSEVRNAGALAASYPFVLYSDLYDHKDFIRGCVNAGFSGLLWTPEVRDGKNKKDFIRRVQTVVFSIQCLINAWYCEEAPWIELDCEKELKELLEMREMVVPYLYQAFEEYKATGKPPIRALVMDYTDDKETYSIDDEYMLGDRILVAPLTYEDHDTRKVYLPKGEWVDFFTQQKVASGWFTVTTENIPVYLKK